MKPRIAIPQPTSFDDAYNRRSWPQYAAAVEAAGGIAVEVPLSASPAEIARIATGCKGILLPGSPADVNPQKYGAERDPLTAAPDAARENADELLLQDAFNMHKPLLGICYGMQSLNVWRSGTLLQHLPDTPIQHNAARTVSDAHTVEIARDSRLRGMISGVGGEAASGLQVNSSHHQAVATPGDGLSIAARSPEDGVIEAIEGIAPGIAPEHFVLGVQWHPERTQAASPASRQIFDAFISAVRHWHPRNVADSVARPDESESD